MQPTILLYVYSFGLFNGVGLVVQSPLLPNQPANSSLVMSPGGAIQKMNPLTQLQVAIKNNIGVHYFSTCVNMNVLLSEDGRMGEFVQLGKCTCL